MAASKKPKSEEQVNNNNKVDHDHDDDDEDDVLGDNELSYIESIALPVISLEPATSEILDVIEGQREQISNAGDEELQLGGDNSNSDSDGQNGKQIEKPSHPKRRKPIGFLHYCCFIKELESPYEYSKGVKMWMLFVYAFAGMVPAMGSAVFYPSVHDIARDFHSNLGVINLSVGLYMLSLGIFPLWWSYLAELKGRRITYLISYSLFFLFNIGCARASSVGMLLVFRVLTGGAASSSQSVGAGALGDIYIPSQRGRANAYFYLGPLCGPLFAPVMAGALTERWGWRSTQYFLMIVSFASFLSILFGLPETLKKKPIPEDVIQSRKRRKEKNLIKYYAYLFFEYVISPFMALSLLKHPAFLFAISYSSFGYGCLYLMNTSIPQLFEAAPYNFSEIIIGLLYLPNGIGYITGSLVSGRWSDHIIKKSLKQNNGVLLPEARLGFNMICAGILVSSGLILFGWSAGKKVFWLVPLIGTFMFGFASLMIFTTTLTFLVDSMPNRRSAAVSVNTFVRCIVAGIASFIAFPLINALGAGWLYTILTGISLVFLVLQVYVKKKGPEWRAKMTMETG
ncbi:major facilitator superfamily domain-containing protein [Lipomyces japonicus]|uniref:major facilitator superfamily domain-containing protein n=1 Tax=Lipomyces japonicus TaxID=56871 RepID=UPI0034D00445